MDPLGKVSLVAVYFLTADCGIPSLDAETLSGLLFCIYEICAEQFPRNKVFGHAVGMVF